MTYLKINYLVSITFLLFAIACKKETSPITGNGEISQSIKSLSEYTGIYVDMPVDIEIKKGTGYSANISAKSNVLSNINLKVDQNGILNIS